MVVTEKGSFGWAAIDSAGIGRSDGPPADCNRAVNETAKKPWSHPAGKQDYDDDPAQWKKPTKSG